MIRKYSTLKGQPMCVKVLFTLAVIFTLVGMSTIVLDMLEIYDIKLCVSMAFIEAGSVINNVIFRNKRKK